MAARSVPPPPISWPGRPAGQPAAQPKVAVAQPAKTFSPIARPRAGADQGAGERLVAVSGGAYRLENGERHVLTHPNGVYNFVHVREQARNRTTTMMSSRSGHAALAAGRPVLYAGTASFEQGDLKWWSNYSGTFQPIAELHAQAGLPGDKFVPWQKLALGGVGLQRHMLKDVRDFTAPQARAPAKPEAAKAEAAKAESSRRRLPVNRQDEAGSGQKAQPQALEYRPPKARHEL